MTLTWPVSFVGDHEVEPAAARGVDGLDVGDAQADRQVSTAEGSRADRSGIDGTDELVLARGTSEVDRERAVAGVADNQVGQAVAVQVGRDDLRRELSR